MKPNKLCAACTALWFSALHGADHVVIIKDYQFQPAQLTIHAGDRVIWRNDEKRTSHSVWFLFAGAVESERLFNAETHTQVFLDHGEFPYRCGPHPDMTGVIRVEQ